METPTVRCDCEAATALAGLNPEAVGEAVKALRNIRDTVESCYVAGGWVPLDAEEMTDITEMANAALAKLEATP